MVGFLGFRAPTHPEGRGWGWAPWGLVRTGIGTSMHKDPQGTGCGEGEHGLPQPPTLSPSVHSKQAFRSHQLVRAEIGSMAWGRVAALDPRAERTHPRGPVGWVGAQGEAWVWREAGTGTHCTFAKKNGPPAGEPPGPTVPSPPELSPRGRWAGPAPGRDPLADASVAEGPPAERPWKAGMMGLDR